MAPPTQIDQRELDEAPASWRRWWRCRGRLVVMPDGSLDMAPGARWTRHEREPQPSQETSEARRLRGSQDYSTLHLGRGTRWIKPKVNR